MTMNSKYYCRNTLSMRMNAGEGIDLRKWRGQGFLPAQVSGAVGLWRSDGRPTLGPLLQVGDDVRVSVVGKYMNKLINCVVAAWKMGRWQTLRFPLDKRYSLQPCARQRLLINPDICQFVRLIK